ncbi:NIPSNAP family protein [Paraburkholderia phymatum]|uniref:NIPSNAP family protein n=1 Tax=Paraburkholderia phymatum TaxID=148447 RepID=A0ACC6UDY8_9BURK
MFGGFESLADREARREARQQDRKWHEFLRSAVVTDYLVSQCSAIYRPTSFSRIC